MTERVFVMPDLGEGLEEGRIVRWLSAEGATVELNQPLVEVETAKAVVEIPSPFAGVIRIVHGSEGEDIAVGAPLVTFEVTGRDGRLHEPGCHERAIVGFGADDTSCTEAREGARDRYRDRPRNGSRAGA